MADTLDIDRPAVKAPYKNKDRRGWRFYVKGWRDCGPGTTVADRYGKDGSVVGQILCEEVSGARVVSGLNVLFQFGKYAKGVKLPTIGRVWPNTDDGWFSLCLHCTAAIDAELGDE
jgi:hypothetical protein